MSDGAWHLWPQEPDPMMARLKDNAWCTPIIEIAYDQWARTRITCDHGTFEAVSGFLNLTESFRRACRVFNMYDHVQKCWQDCDPPKEWTEGDDEDAEYWRHEKVECNLFRGHDGECRYLSDAEIEARRKVIRR